MSRAAQWASSQLVCHTRSSHVSPTSDDAHQVRVPLVVRERLQPRHPPEVVRRDESRLPHRAELGRHPRSSEPLLAALVTVAGDVRDLAGGVEPPRVLEVLGDDELLARLAVRHVGHDCVVAIIPDRDDVVASMPRAHRDDLAADVRARARSCRRRSPGSWPRCLSHRPRMPPPHRRSRRPGRSGASAASMEDRPAVRPAVATPAKWG